MISVCGDKTKRGCMAKHVRGEPVKHATCFMSESGKSQVSAANIKRARLNYGGSNADNSDNEENEF